MFEVRSSAARLLVLQCDSGDMHSELIACARYNIINEHTALMDDVSSASVVHVLFIVQLPRIAGGCFIGFQVHIRCLSITRHSLTQAKMSTPTADMCAAAR